MDRWSLPEALEVQDRQYAIHADFRDVLEVIRWLNDSNEDERVRHFVALKLFFEDWDRIPRQDQEEAARQMMIFIAGGVEDTGPDGPRLIDWEQDQGMIVADVNKVAGCEIRALPFVHWWTFLAWFGTIGEGQLSTVVSIRDKRRRGKKLEVWEKEYYQQHKAAVDLQPRYTAEELAERERLKKLLGEGGDVIGRRQGNNQHGAG